MVTVAPRDVYFRLWEKVGQPEGFVFPWKMANMEESRIASNMRLFGRYLRCSWVANAHFNLNSVNSRNEAWWLEAGCSIQSSAYDELLTFLLRRLMPYQIYEITCKAWWRTRVASPMCHLFHWRCSLGWRFQDLTHLQTLEKPRSPLSPWGSWRQACLCVLWPCVPCPLDSWNTFSERSSFALLFAALQLWYRAFTSKAFQKVANDFLSIMFTFPYLQLSVCDLTSKNQYHSQIFYQKDQLRHPTKSLAQQGLYILILYFRVHGFRKFKLDTYLSALARFNSWLTSRGCCAINSHLGLLKLRKSSSSLSWDVQMRVYWRKLVEESKSELWACRDFQCPLWTLWLGCANGLSINREESMLTFSAVCHNCSTAGPVSDLSCWKMNAEEAQLCHRANVVHQRRHLVHVVRLVVLFAWSWLWKSVESDGCWCWEDLVAFKDFFQKYFLSVALVLNLTSNDRSSQYISDLAQRVYMLILPDSFVN